MAASQLDVLESHVRRLNVRITIVEDDLDRLRLKKKKASSLMAALKKIDWSDPTTITYVYIVAIIIGAYLSKKASDND